MSQAAAYRELPTLNRAIRSAESTGRRAILPALRARRAFLMMVIHQGGLS